MPTTIDFETVGAGFSTSYSEFGYTLTSGVNIAIPAQNMPFWSGKSFSNVTDGGYLLNNYSSDVIIVHNDAGKAFGAFSIGIDGFNWSGFGSGGNARTGTSAVTFTFTGVRAADGVAFDWSAPATDLVDGFQTITLPSAFNAGLSELRWTVSGGTGWGAFDNLAVQTNRAPTADAVSATLLPGATYIGNFAGHDADGQALTYEFVGAPPPGVYSGATPGTFAVLSDANTSSQTFSFQYRAFDGSEYSAPATVTVTVAPPPNGPDITGTKKADVLNGTAGGEKIYGLAGNDKINGNGGADKIFGDDGNDTLSGGDGHDWLDGGDGKDVIGGDAGNDTITAGDGDDVLDGGAGNDLIFGCDGKDTLTGGAGDDTLTGGDDNDQFVFGQNFGDDVILDFRPGSWKHDKDNDGWDDHDKNHDNFHDKAGDHGNNDHWNAGDTIRISPATFGSFDALMSHAHQTWYGVVINADDGSSITLVGLRLSSLHVNDFIFS